jgi:hypothetical protein
VISDAEHWLLPLFPSSFWRWTAAGKARVARNARRHGLNLSALHDPTLSKEVGGLARAIAGADADAQCIMAAGARSRQRLWTGAYGLLT